MGGLHAYYCNDKTKVGIVMDCNVISVYTIEEGASDSCVDYVLDDDIDIKAYMDELCLSYEKNGFKDAPWMFGNSSLWDEYNTKEIVEQLVTFSPRK
jgi:hypothetical protein